MALGYTVNDLQRRMDSQEFTDWCAYFLIEPHGYQIDQWRMAMLGSSICNAIKSTIPMPKGAKRKWLKPADFYPDQKPADDLTPEQRQYIERKRKKKRG